MCAVPVLDDYQVSAEDVLQEGASGLGWDPAWVACVAPDHSYQ